MKKIFVLMTTLAVLLTACSNKEDQRLSDLEKLKKEREVLDTKIAELEAELIAEGIIKTDKSITVKIEKAVKQEFKSYLEIQGKVDGDENVSATSKTVGVVTGVYVKEGDMVRRGQTLASLDAGVLQQSLAEMQSSLVFLEDIYNRQKALWEQNIGSEIQYLTAKNNKEGMEQRIATLKQQISMYYITSPINGRIEEASLKIGQSAAPGVPAFRVVNFSTVKVQAEVSESYSSNIKVGNEVLVYFPDLGKEVPVKLSFVSKFINPSNRSFKVECNLKPEKGMEFRANMVAVMKINDYTNPETFIIPVSLIQKDSDGEFIFIAVQDGKNTIARKLSIQKGKVYDGKAEILSGLKEGDQIITTGFSGLKDGDIIKISK